MIQDIFLKKPFLAWFVKDKNKLSQESTMEQIFNYGDWHDYLKAEKSLGIKRVKAIFEDLKNKKRTNLRPKTVNYFSLYFTKYA